RELTDAIEAGLRKVTLNLARWEDLPLIKTAEGLYAFRLGDGAGNAERLRNFAAGVDFFRQEQPERFERLRASLLEFKRQLARVLKVDLDLIATVKFTAMLVLAPLWWAGMTLAAWFCLSRGWGIFVGIGALPLALHTRYFLERWRGALEDILTFLTLSRRS